MCDNQRPTATLQIRFQVPFKFRAVVDSCESASYLKITNSRDKTRETVAQCNVLTVCWHSLYYILQAGKKFIIQEADWWRPTWTLTAVIPTRCGSEILDCRRWGKICGIRFSLKRQRNSNISENSCSNSAKQHVCFCIKFRTFCDLAPTVCLLTLQLRASFVERVDSTTIAFPRSQLLLMRGDGVVQFTVAIAQFGDQQLQLAALLLNCCVLEFGETPLQTIAKKIKDQTYTLRHRRCASRALGTYTTLPHIAATKRLATSCGSSAGQFWRSAASSVPADVEGRNIHCSRFLLSRPHLVTTHRRRSKAGEVTDICRLIACIQCAVQNEWHRLTRTFLRPASQIGRFSNNSLIHLVPVLVQRGSL